MKTPKELVLVTWLDAIIYGSGGREKYSTEDMKENPSKMLEETQTSGYIFSQDDKAIIIMHEENSDEDESTFTVIPRDWVKRIKRYKE